MARIGGLNPLAMMPGQGGMPLPRPKKPVEESGDQPRAAGDNEALTRQASVEVPPHNRQVSVELKTTQEFKPVGEHPTKTSTNDMKPIPVKGPAPPPRKPGAAAAPQSTPASQEKSNPPAKMELPGPPSKGDPSKSVSGPAAPSAEPAKPAAATTGKKYCKANFDLEHPPKGCPKFKKGDFAECVEIKGEWSHVIFLKTGEEGHVPTAYFAMDVQLPTTGGPAATGPVKKMKALFPFAPPKPKGFVPLKAGEIVTLEKGEPGEEWWVVKNAAGLSGYVPHNYVKVI